MTYQSDNKWEEHQARMESERKEMEWAIEYSRAQPAEQRKMVKRRLFWTSAAIILLILVLGIQSLFGGVSSLVFIAVLFGLLMIVLLIGHVIPSFAQSVRQIGENRRRYGLWSLGCSLLVMAVAGLCGLLIVIQILQPLLK